MNTLQELEEYYKGFGLSNYFNQVKDKAKHSIHIKYMASPEDQIKIGESKLGGKPDLPKSLRWPSNGKTQSPLSFVAQINVTEAHPFDIDGALPSSGMLYFFYDVESFPWGFDPEDREGSKVIFVSEEDLELERKEFPSSLEDHQKFLPAKLQFESQLNVPDYFSDLLDFELSDDDYEAYCDYLDTQFDRKQNKLLGHSNNIQNGMEFQCELVTNGIYCGNAQAYQNHPELEKNVSNWNLLVQVDSNEDLNMMWGDSGRLYFWIKNQDLMQRKFDQSWLILQCF